MSYDDLERDYDRRVIDHAISYAQGHVHTNGLENFWSLLKRALHGTYVNVEPFHCFGIWTNKRFGLTSAKTMTLAVSRKRCVAMWAKLSNTQSLSQLRAMMAFNRRGKRRKSVGKNV
jgi:hypothetical protein